MSPFAISSRQRRSKPISASSGRAPIFTNWRAFSRRAPTKSRIGARGGAPRSSSLGSVRGDHPEGDGVEQRVEPSPIEARSRAQRVDVLVSASTSGEVAHHIEVVPLAGPYELAPQLRTERDDPVVSERWWHLAKTIDQYAVPIGVGGLARIH